MFSGSHIKQAVALVDAEINRNNSLHATNWYYNKGHLKLNEDVQIVGKFELFEHSILLYKKLDTNELEIEFIDLDNEGFIYPKVEIKEKEIIKADNYIYEQSSENGMFKIGVKAKIAVLAHKDVFEDTVVVSKSFADNLKHIERRDIVVTLGMDDEFTRFSDESLFPTETDKIITSIRTRTSYNLMSFNKENISETNRFRDHKIVEGSGKINTRVYLGNDFELSGSPTHVFLKESFDKEIEYHKSFFKIVKGNLEDETTISTTLANIINYYESLFGEKRDVTLLKRRDISDKSIVKFITIKENGMVSGDKLAVNMYGGKSLVRVLEDSEMPIASNGKVMDVVSTAQYIIGRMNLSQLIESEYNKVIEQFELRILEEKELEKKVVILSEFLFDVCELKIDFSYEDLVEMINEEDFKLIAVIDEHKSLIQDFKPEVYDQLTLKGKILEGKTLILENYVLKLKHLAKKKSSFCSLPSSNEAGKPIRSNKALLSYSNSPVSLGNMEFSILKATAPSVLKEIYDFRSFNKGNRETFAKIMTKVDLEEISLDKLVNKEMYSKQSTQKLFEEYKTSLGIEI